MRKFQTMKPTLKYGSKGDTVKELQSLLSLYPDGLFGNLTKEAVIAFQAANNLVADGIVGAKTWEALERLKTANLGTQATSNTTQTIAGCTISKSKRKITRIVVHSTATREGINYSVDWIRKLHKNKGYSDIGYHYVIYTDGSLHIGRNININGAHAKGYNQNSIGIVYVGGTDTQGKAKDTRTTAQKSTLLALLKALRKYYPQAQIMGHRNLNKTACPSFDAKEEYKGI